MDDFILSNINSRGLFKSKEVDVLNFPGATSSDVLTKIDDVLNKKTRIPNCSCWYKNDLTSDINVIKCKKDC